MPTTTIESPLDDLQFRRRVAKQLAFWWRRHGVDPAHVLTRFVLVSGDDIYSGPFPMSGGPSHPAPPFALVGCVVAEDRERTFRAAYARHVRHVLEPEIPADRVIVAVHPTDPADYFTPASSWEREEDAS